MTKNLIISNKFLDFNKKISISGDKSLSIRWVLFSSIATGKSKAYNLLLSEDVLAAINSIRKFGIRVNVNKKFCEIDGKGINGYRFKKKNYT